MSFSRRLRFSVSLSIPNFSSFLQNSSHSHFHSQPPSIQNVDDAVSLSVLTKILKRGYPPDTVTLNTLIKGLCLKGQVKKALHFHDKLLAQGFQLNQVGYGTLINGVCKIGDTRAAIKLLKKIDGRLTKPDVVMYSTIIDECC